MTLPVIDIAGSTTQAGAPGLVSRQVSVGEYHLQVYEAGDPAGVPVLWLHGSGPGVSALSNWERMITELMPTYRNIAPDVLGFGESSHPADPPRGTRAYAELRADTLLALLDELEIDTIHVVGNSMGGLFALRMAQKAPERLDRIVLMGTGGAPLKPTEGLIKMVLYYENPTAENMRSIMGSFIYDTSNFADLDAIVADRVIKAGRPDVQRSHEATFDRTAGGPLMFTPEELGAITHEVLVLHGREDLILPLEGSLFMQANLPAAQLHVLPRAGHWMQLEQGERLAAQVNLFFTENS